MKKLPVLFAVLCCITYANAQYVGGFEIPLDRFQVLDSAQLKFSYTFRYKPSFIKDESDTTKLEDLQVLLIGNKVSKYYSKYYFDYCQQRMDKVEPYKPKESSACSMEVFKNFPNSKISVTEQAGAYSFGGNYLYEEAIPCMSWKIMDDTCRVLSYLCQKATTIFRGRNYTAWFAPEIPSDNGPWKFGGLPGLILKIGDDNLNFEFECVGVEQLTKSEPIKFYTLKYTKLSRLDLDKLYRRFFTNPIQFWNDVQSEMRGQITQDDVDKIKRTYNPIELN